MLPHRDREYLGATAIRGYSAFSKATGYWNLTIWFISIISTGLLGKSYHSVDMQSVYCTAPAAQTIEAMIDFVKAGKAVGYLFSGRSSHGSAWKCFSNKSPNEGTKVWWSIQLTKTVRLAVTEISSNKLPGKTPECEIRERNWRATEKYPPTQGTDVKLLFLRSHFDCFPKNYGDLGEERKERFHQDICIMEERYKGRWAVNFPVDNWWCLKGDAVADKHGRKSMKRPFIHECLLLCIFQFTMAECEFSANVSDLNLVLLV